MKNEDEKKEPDYHDSAVWPGHDPAKTAEPQPARTPSQAEGDRETIIEDIKTKEKAGKL